MVINEKGSRPRVHSVDIIEKLNNEKKKAITRKEERKSVKKVFKSNKKLGDHKVVFGNLFAKSRLGKGTY